jgi:hypothetical protein
MHTSMVTALPALTTVPADGFWASTLPSCDGSQSLVYVGLTLSPRLSSVLVAWFWGSATTLGISGRLHIMSMTLLPLLTLDPPAGCWPTTVPFCAGSQLVVVSKLEVSPAPSSAPAAAV